MFISKKIYINSVFNAIIVLGGYMKLKKSVKRFFVIVIIIIMGIIVIINFPNKKKSGNKKISTKDIVSNACKKIDYCKKNNIDRYVKYYKKNNDLKTKDVITRVNLNLDYSFYTHTKKTSYLNKDYILVNKYLYLGEDYVPEDLEDIDINYSREGMKLVSSARKSFEKMAKAASSDDNKIIAMSSYRSYDYQVNLYNNYAATDGIDAADKYSARAGFSEHQTGLCIDMYDGVKDYTNFEETDSFTWMQNNAHKYGFILRFPKGKENITGYQYESWHYRYVGVKAATYIHEHNITFEEYYTQNIENNIKQ